MHSAPALAGRSLLAGAETACRRLPARRIEGRVLSISGMELRAGGLRLAASLGDHVLVGGRVRGEVVGIREKDVQILPFGAWEGVAAGMPVQLLPEARVIRPDLSWLGRVIDPFAEPLDNLPLAEGTGCYPIRAAALPAFERRPVGTKLETGIKAFDIFTPICRGQRMGVFAGSGVGKSTLMAMLARQSDAEVIVMGLVGERGREVQNFIQRDLGPEGMARSCLIVATSDLPPLSRRQAAWTATAVAEYFRDQGKQVLLMLDSVTRFAMAQREIGLSAGEPPATRGYTPTVFAELPKLLERSGPGSGSKGDITAIYTVLVDGDDMNEPVADAVRGILDGHVILDRRIAENGRYPAIHILRSVSRMLPQCHMPVEQKIMTTARRALARYADVEDLARIGAYRPGTDPETDSALAFARTAETFLRQGHDEKLSSAEGFAALYGLLLEAGYKIDLGEDLSPGA
ncbi:FliI/YscN family ATPase [Pseudogemmobacter faecipullorum]|uniref:FliI/YscN family ATPase n=1 Tax=Pseudogemmobacter faecipullorum TaxID=2755041 RepID=A0ABS8CN96_9RHOB|nr:FliI/YscN family ATPase [Pseudogemmobacter faecipullorum]MCB5410875.1 FliI/YscN family ATPase [Pseudogemmobacter faecipullorum]